MPLRVLAVDDSASIRQLVALVAGAAGHVCVGAPDGAEALRLAAGDARGFDVVLTDQNMPHMDGLTLVRALRALPRYARTPILVLTTESSDDMRRRGREAGATGWLTKPFDPQTLRDALVRLAARADTA